jgi:hypothetical protein
MRRTSRCLRAAALAVVLGVDGGRPLAFESQPSQFDTVGVDVPHAPDLPRDQRARPAQPVGRSSRRPGQGAFMA